MAAIGIIFVASVVIILFAYTGKVAFVWRGIGTDLGHLTIMWHRISLGIFGFAAAIFMLVCLGSNFFGATIVNATITTQEAEQITVPLQVRQIPLLGEDVRPKELTDLVVGEWEHKSQDEIKTGLLEKYRFFPDSTIVTGVPSPESKLWGDLNNSQRLEVIQQFTKPDASIKFRLYEPLP